MKILKNYLLPKISQIIFSDAIKKGKLQFKTIRVRTHNQKF